MPITSVRAIDELQKQPIPSGLRDTLNRVAGPAVNQSVFARIRRRFASRQRFGIGISSIGFDSIRTEAAVADSGAMLQV
ncbi:hypothetical protein NP284_41880 [Rhodopseudomonas pseudopalustris]